MRSFFGTQGAGISARQLSIFGTRSAHYWYSTTGYFTGIFYWLYKLVILLLQNREIFF
jgi:hypothetical protein